MDFNIQDHLQKARERFEKKDPIKDQLLVILSLYKKDIRVSDFDYSSGRLSLRSLHPMERIHVKKNKESIIASCKKQDIHLRDIM